MEEGSEKQDNSITRADANTQCGDALTVDEENIVVMVKTFSPQRPILSDSENEGNPDGNGQGLNDEVSLTFCFQSHLVYTLEFGQYPYIYVYIHIYIQGDS